jgi:hypothetical protein
MRTITTDHFGRCAELDHSVLEEIQAMMEAHGRPGPLAIEWTADADTTATEPRPVSWMKAALNVFS